MAATVSPPDRAPLRTSSQNPGLTSYNLPSLRGDFYLKGNQRGKTRTRSPNSFKITNSTLSAKGKESLPVSSPPCQLHDSSGDMYTNMDPEIAAALRLLGDGESETDGASSDVNTEMEDIEQEMLTREKKFYDLFHSNLSHLDMFGTELNECDEALEKAENVLDRPLPGTDKDGDDGLDMLLNHPSMQRAYEHQKEIAELKRAADKLELQSCKQSTSKEEVVGMLEKSMETIEQVERQAAAELQKHQMKVEEEIQRETQIVDLEIARIKAEEVQRAKHLQQLQEEAAKELAAKKIKAATTLQAGLRGWLGRKLGRTKRREQQRLADIQREKEMKEEEKRRREKCATLLQTCARGFLARRRYVLLKADAEMKKRVNSAIIIQASFRRYVDMKAYAIKKKEILKAKQAAAAITIQTVVRVWLAKRELESRRAEQLRVAQVTAVKQLQRCIRGWLGRQQFLSLCDKRQYERKVQAAIAMQALFRGNRVRAIYGVKLQELRNMRWEQQARHSAALVIQNAWRKHLERQEQLMIGEAIYAAAVTIQAWWRSISVRRKLSHVLNAAKFDDDDNFNYDDAVDLSTLDFKEEEFDIKLPDLENIDLGNIPPGDEIFSAWGEDKHDISKDTRIENASRASSAASSITDRSVSANSSSNYVQLAPAHTRRVTRIEKDWGFKNSGTAEAMLRRAKKLKKKKQTKGRSHRTPLDKNLMALHKSTGLPSPHYLQNSPDDVVFDDHTCSGQTQGEPTQARVVLPRALGDDVLQLPPLSPTPTILKTPKPQRTVVPVKLPNIHTSSPRRCVISLDEDVKQAKS
eukprot:m.26791 g.26791  ORF g.26791 m.26791 type:complete len:808 (+) comp7834_c0_seq1:230-2653(+)